MLLRRVTDHVKDQNWFAVTLDFIIVVVGVFVGLQAQEWREDVASRERLDRIVAALNADLKDSRRVEARFWADIQAGLVEFEESYARGERPPPFVYRIKGSDTAPNLIWGSLQDAGIGELLDPELLFELSYFYSERYGIGVKVTRYMQLIESMVLPHIDGDPKFFYDASGEVMRPEYRATMDRLREWGQYINDLGPWSECLERRLASASEPGETCRSDWNIDSSEDHF